MGVYERLYAGGASAIHRKDRYMNNITNEATEIGNNFSDTSLPNMSLGEGGANIDLDAVKETEYTPERETTEPDITEEITQGMLEQELYNLYSELENLTNIYEEVKNSKLKGHALNTAHELGLMNKEQIKEHSKNKDIATVDKEALNLISNELGNIRNKIKDTKDNEKYDNRTDEQKREDKIREKIQEREDNSYQRAVADMRAAGLNPATLTAGASAGGGGLGGGGSSASDEEEKKRRKRKKEEERRKAEEAARKRQQMIQIMQMLGIAGTTLGTTAIRSRSWERYGNIRNIPALKRLKGKNNKTQYKPEWLDKYLDDLKKYE